MKKSFLLIVSGIFFASAYSQNPQLPPGSKPRQLPAPKIKTVAQPDLVITGISFVSISPESIFSWVRISVTIKNAGDLRVSNTTLRGEGKSLVSGSVANRWVNISPTQAVGPLNPGQSVTTEYVFKVSNELAYKNFAIKVFADAGAIVDESDERNNSSAELAITLN